MIRCLSAALLLLTLPLIGLQAEDAKTAQPKPVGGKSELLRFIPKVFATLQHADVAKHRITILVEGEKEPTTWNLNPEAELKIHGWWGRLDQFKLGDRIWVWFDLDRKHQKKSILMLADEISQQDISGFPPTLEAVDAEKLTLKFKSLKGDSPTLPLADPMYVHLDKTEAVVSGKNDGTSIVLTTVLKPGQKYFVQTTGNVVSRLTDAAGLEKLRKAQRLALRERWEKDGLPGTVTFLHPLSGELEIMLDHEAIRWGRNLKEGDRITIREGGRIAADVKLVRPWRERTQVRLVLGGFDQSDFSLGQRVQVLVPVLTLDADLAELPPDIGRERSKPARIDWFLASTYCTCSVANNTCTGMFYTLASCNVNACGMPNHIRDTVAELIDKGMSDRQIWDELKKSQGALMVKPHLLP